MNENASSSSSPSAQEAAAQAFSGQLSAADLARVMDVKVEVTVELGRRRISIAEVLQMGPQSVLEFFKKADEPLDVFVNGRMIARGEAVVMGDRYGVRITEVLSPGRMQGSINPEETAR